MTRSFARPRCVLTSFAALVALFAMFASVAPRPARADSASTTATVLGAAAAIGAILISNNVRHKQAQANTPVGRTQDGGTILGDGRVVYPNGDVLYTGTGNGQQCTFNGYGVPCSSNPQVYYPQNYNGGRHDNGHHYGHYKHHKHHDNDDNYNNNNYNNDNNDGDDRKEKGRHGHDD